MCSKGQKRYDKAYTNGLIIQNGLGGIHSFLDK